MRNGWLLGTVVMGCAWVSCGGDDDEFRVFRRYTTCAAADFDLDGDPDLFLGAIAPGPADFPSESDDLFLNDGAGGFTLSPTALPPRSGGMGFGTVSANVEDLNADGAPDLVLTRVDQTQLAGGGIQLLLNDGAGAFSDGSAAITVSFDQSQWMPAVTPADFDGDGRPELAVNAGFPGESVILRETASGTYDSHREHLDASGLTTAQLVPGNFGGSAALDLVLVFGDVVNSRIEIIENVSPAAGQLAWTARSSLTVDVRGASAVPIDWDADGDLDLILVELIFLGQSTDGIRFLRNEGNFTFAEVGSVLSNGPVILEHPRDNAVADFNGDGVSDLFVADHGIDSFPFPGTQNRLLLSGPPGTLAEVSEARLGVRSGFTHSVCAVDVDNDGDVDIVTADLNSEDESGVVLSINDGSGFFSTGLIDVPSSRL